MIQVVDSFSPHTDRSCQALAAQGFAGALRYQYNTSRSEVGRLHAHGLSFGLIFERNGNAAVVNPSLGLEHGRAAVTFARSIGLPEGCAIYFAEADTMVRRDQYPGARRYWELAAGPTRDAGYRVGAYGGSKLIDHLHSVGAADLTWETGAMSWNEWVHSSTAALRQLLGQPTIGGVQVDLNDVLANDWGQWTPLGASIPSARPGPPIPEVTDMAAHDGLYWQENAKQTWLVSGNTKLYIDGVGYDAEAWKAQALAKGVPNHLDEPAALFLEPLIDISDPPVSSRTD